MDENGTLDSCLLSRGSSSVCLLLPLPPPTKISPHKREQEVQNRSKKIVEEKTIPEGVSNYLEYTLQWSWLTMKHAYNITHLKKNHLDWPRTKGKKKQQRCLFLVNQFNHVEKIPEKKEDTTGRERRHLMSPDASLHIIWLTNKCWPPKECDQRADDFCWTHQGKQLTVELLQTDHYLVYPSLSLSHDGKGTKKRRPKGTWGRHIFDWTLLIHKCTYSNIRRARSWCSRQWEEV